MVLSLTAITVVVGCLLGYVASITDAPIKAAADAKQQKAITDVVPGEGNTVGEEIKKVAANGTDASIFPVSNGGKIVGHAVKAISKNGFGGNITVMIGFDVEQRDPRLGRQDARLVPEGREGRHHWQKSSQKQPDRQQRRRRGGCHHRSNDFVACLP